MEKELVIELYFNNIPTAKLSHIDIDSETFVIFVLLPREKSQYWFVRIGK